MRTLFLGAYGYGNLGDELCLIEAMQEFPSTEIYVRSRRPEFTQNSIHNANYIPWQPGTPNPIHSVPFDRVVIGGGGLFYDKPHNSGWDFLCWARAAINSGCEVHIHNVGINSDFAVTSDMVDIFNSVNSISVRDNLSKSILLKSGILTLVTTRSFSETEIEADMDFAKILPSGDYVGVSITNRNETHEYLDARSRKVAQYLQQYKNKKIIPIVSTVHMLSQKENDIQGFLSFQKKYLHNFDIVLPQMLDREWWESNMNPMRLKAIISKCSVLISERKHNSVHAISCGVPVEGINICDDGVVRVFDQLSMSKHTVIDFNQYGNLSLNVLDPKDRVEAPLVSNDGIDRSIVKHGSRNKQKLMQHMSDRLSYFGHSSDVSDEWISNLMLAVKERNERKIELSSKPIYLDVELNNMCNLKCEFCICVPGHVRDFNSSEAKLTIEEINQLSPLFKYAEILETSKKGEPFLTADLFQYTMQKIRDVNPFVITQTVTNGTIMTNDLIQSLILLKLDHMYISINSHEEELFRKFTGGTFSSILKNLDKIQSDKARHNSREPFLHFNCQLGKIADPFKVLDLAKKYGVIECNFIKTQPFTDNYTYRGNAAQDYMSASDIEKWMDDIVTKANELFISVNFPAWDTHKRKIIGSTEHFYYPSTTKYFDLNLNCPTDAPWFRYCTSMRTVQPCCWSGPFDDWTKAPFESIWNGDYLKSLRTMLSGGKYPAVCNCRY